ncbi:hypothetical protein C8R46DRAFT_480544 [Mycena filopes]|nr:hypothetical protein C8R46DRAFT_480544 [Mycena filopes]
MDASQPEIAHGNSSGFSPEQPSKAAASPLHFIVVGCGLGGLAAAFCLGRAGHKVTVLESAPRISEVGAGIQISPNLSRLLIRWGLGNDLRKAAVKPQAITLRRWKNGERIGWTKWGENMDRDYGAPYLHIHRADLLDMLFKLATPYMTLHLNSRVVALDADRAQVTLTSGKIFTGDIILGADGVKSMIREVVLGRPDKPIPTGDAAYRAIVPISEMIKDEDLKTLVEGTEMTSWVGPGRHIVGYVLTGGTKYNLVMAHPTEVGLEEEYDVEASVQKMREDFAGWEPRIQKLMALVPNTLIWPLFDRDPLDTWVHPTGNVVLLGDACHPMLPYRAQGSAMAIEDAAVLGVLFSRSVAPNEVRPLLEAYRALRNPRTTESQLAARSNKRVFHIPDGPEQEARDVSMRKAMEIALCEERGEKAADGAVPTANSWADRARNWSQYGYDAEEAAREWCTANEPGVSRRQL